jgi:hypothetical protein
MFSISARIHRLLPIPPPTRPNLPRRDASQSFVWAIGEPAEGNRTEGVQVAAGLVRPSPYRTVEHFNSPLPLLDILIH